MAKKRYYAVAIGRQPGIYRSCKEADAQTRHFKGFRMKSFKNKKEAERYILIIQNKKNYYKEDTPRNIKDSLVVEKPLAFMNNKKREYMMQDSIMSNEDYLDDEVLFYSFNNIKTKYLNGPKVVAYVDGSYNPKENVYGAGVVIVKDGNVISTLSRKRDDAEYVRFQNTAGEVYAAMLAMEYCIKMGIKNLDIYYDFEGVENIPTKHISNNNLQKMYDNYCKQNQRHIKVDFHKVKSHSGNRFNDMADMLAKEAVGISKIKLQMCI